MMFRQKYITCALVLMAFLVLPCSLRAEEAKDAEADMEKFSIKKEVYSYSSANRRDPFLSKIEEARKAQQQSLTEGAKTPQESYDLKQMRLVAVVSDIGGAYALVSLPDGKFYTITRGMKIGLRGGVVSDINSDKLIVEEKLKDFKGRIKSQNSFLRLRQEEAEK